MVQPRSEFRVEQRSNSLPATPPGNYQHKLLCRAAKIGGTWTELQWGEKKEISQIMNTPPPPPPPPALTAPLWRAAALYYKTNEVSALYFLLRETSDEWVDGQIHLMKTCRLGYRRGPCAALGCHGNRCTCWIFFSAPIWPLSDWHVGVTERKGVLPAWLQPLSPFLLRHDQKKRAPRKQLWILNTCVFEYLRVCRISG